MRERKETDRTKENKFMSLPLITLVLRGSVLRPKHATHKAVGWYLAGGVLPVSLSIRKNCSG